MKTNKNTGSYYTPFYLADFIITHVLQYIDKQDNISILEPSVGDGVFIKAFNSSKFLNTKKNYFFTSIEKNKIELEKTINQSSIESRLNTKYLFINSDFLKIHEYLNTRYSLIIGNPPYIRKNLLTKKQLNRCYDIHQTEGLSNSSVKNIWSAFLIRCSRLLEANGILAFVLPAELLQVNFSREIRSYLISMFDRIEIFTFDDLLFDQIGQDTIVLMCFKNAKNKGQYYTRIKNKDQLMKRSYILSSNKSLSNTNVKWTHHSIASEDIELILQLKGQLKTIDHYCESRPGIVTAANDFFIINSAIEREYKLKRFTKPIIQKGVFVNGSVVFDQDDFNKLISDGRPSKLLCIPDKNKNLLPEQLRTYLKGGEVSRIKDRYKCKVRDKWYVIPNIGSASDGFFFKRSYHYPKILKNDANVLVTDSAYKLSMKEDYMIENFIYSFYNSLTLTFAELDGRYYGGGVLELTPKEFKYLPLPLIAISDNNFDTYRYLFEKKDTIEQILEKYDETILGSALHINTEIIQKIQSIRKKLILKRLRIE